MPQSDRCGAAAALSHRWAWCGSRWPLALQFLGLLLLGQVWEFSLHPPSGSGIVRGFARAQNPDWVGVPLQSEVKDVNPLKGLVFYTSRGEDSSTNVPKPETGAMSLEFSECMSLRPAAD